MFIFCLIVDRTRACLKMHVLSYCVLGIMCVACVLHLVVHMQFRSKLVHDIINEAYLPKPRHQFSDFENASIVLEIGNTNTQALDTKHKAQIPTPIPQHTQKQTFERAQARVRENMSRWPGFGAIGNQSSDILARYAADRQVSRVQMLMIFMQSARNSSRQCNSGARDMLSRFVKYMK